MATANMSSNTKTNGELKLKKERNRRRRRVLGVFLLIECFVLLLMYPSYLGIPLVTNFFTWIGNLIAGLLWPVFPRDEGTYRETIFIVCTWVSGWGIYPLLCFLGRWLIPVWYVGTWIFGGVLQLRLNRTPKPPKTTNESCFGKVKCSLDRLKCLQANEYLRQQMEQNTSFFPPVSGIWVRRFGGVRQSEKDYIVPWGKDNTIILRNLGSIPMVKIVLKDGIAYLGNNEEAYEMIRNRPIILQHNNAGDKVIQDAVITWIGG